MAPLQLFGDATQRKAIQKPIGILDTNVISGNPATPERNQKIGEQCYVPGEMGENAHFLVETSKGCFPSFFILSIMWFLTHESHAFSQGSFL
jgi:hypothetical protein